MKLIKQFSWRRISQSEIRNSAAAESESGQKGKAFPQHPYKRVFAKRDTPKTGRASN